MREQLSIDEMAGYGEFLALIKEHFASSLSTLFSEEVSFDDSENGSADIEGLQEGYEGQTAIYFSEKESGSEGVLLFKTSDITALADMMMMGDGEGSEDLDDELKDAVSELSTQMLSAVNVPFSEKFDEKVAFSVASVESVSSELNLTEDQFYYSELSLSVKDKEMPLRLGLGDRFSSKIDDANDDGNESDTPLENPDDSGPSQSESVSQSGTSGGRQNMNMLLDVDIPVSVKVGSTKMFLKDIVGLGPGNIIELDEYADEPVELMVNNKPIARGEVVVVDGYFGIRIKEIISIEDRIKKLKD